MNRSNIHRLIGVLEGVQAHIDKGDLVPEQFDMNGWGEEAPCGTVHCAAGWAVATKAIPGLRHPVTYKYADGRKWTSYAPRTENTEDPFEAMAEVLGIEYEVSEWLFDPDHYGLWPTPTDVIVRLRGLLDDNPA